MLYIGVVVYVGIRVYVGVMVEGLGPLFSKSWVGTCHCNVGLFQNAGHKARRMYGGCKEVCREILLFG